MSSSAAPTRRRSTLFLFLYVLGMGSAQRALRESPSTAYALGTISVPILFLVLGTVTAFRDRARVARVIAVGMCATCLVAFTLGVWRGVQRRQALDETGRHVDAMQAGLLDTLQDEDATTEDREKTMRAATAAMQGSENEITAGMGRAMQSVFDALAVHGRRLDAAVVACEDERFLDMTGMLRGGTCTWHHEVLAEYETAATESLRALDGSPALIRQALERESLPAGLVDGVVRGAARTLGPQKQLMRSHVASAGAHRALVTFVESNAAAFTLESDGSFWIEDEVLSSEYDELADAIDHAENEIARAVQAYLDAVAQG